MKALDVKDKQILHSLSNNARVSFSDLSRISGIPRNIVKNRITNLEKNKIIKAYKLTVNYKLLGFEEYEVYLRLSGVDKEKMESIINSFINHKNVSWIGVCFGNYDIKMSFYARNNHEFQDVLTDALSGFKEHIKAQETVGITHKYKMDNTLFLNTILREKFNPFTKNEELLKENKKRTTLDDKDRKIMLALSKNPKANLSELSKATNLTIQGAKNRLDSLYSRNIIMNTKTLINGQTLGFVWATCLFKLNLTEEQEEILERYILNMAGTTSAVRLIGRWDLGITFFSESVQELQTNMNDFKSAFKDGIKDYDSLIILDSYKYPLIPTCVLE